MKEDPHSSPAFMKEQKGKHFDSPDVSIYNSLVLGIVALQLLGGLHCLLKFLLLEFHFLHGEVQFLGEHSDKFHLLLRAPSLVQ
jgi:hypothetical protein